MKRKFGKRIAVVSLAAVMALQGHSLPVLADSSQIVTLGADLTEAQKEKMFEYFGVSKDEVVVIEVNNQEERKYLEGVATEAQIGTHTYSCSYIMPTNADVINVKTANLTWVSTSMIANTLVTAGIKSCDVVAASPIKVSGTGALTGIMKSYENVTDETLDEDKKKLATEELQETGELADAVGKDEAAAVMNEVKSQVIKDDIIDDAKIQEIIDQVGDYYDLEIPDNNKEQITELMKKIGEEDYDFNAIEGTMDNLQDKLVEDLDTVSESLKDKIAKDNKGFFQKVGDFFVNIFKGIGDFFKGLFGGGDDGEKKLPQVDPNSILNNVNDAVLGGDSSKDSEKESNANTDSKEENNKKETKEEQTDQPKETQNQETVPDDTAVPDADTSSKEDNVLGADETEESINTAE